MGQRWTQTRRLPEAHHGEVRQPWTSLAPVDADRFETLLYLAGECGGATRGIAEEEHPDAPRLSVPIELELERMSPANSLGQNSGDLCKLCRRPRAEEGKRDVKVSARHDPPGSSPPHATEVHVTELTLLPGAHAVEHPLGKTQGEEEAQSLIPLHATG